MTTEQIYYMSLLYSDGSWTRKDAVHARACNALGVQPAKAARAEVLACEWVEITKDSVRATVDGMEAVWQRARELALIK